MVVLGLVFHHLHKDFIDSSIWLNRELKNPTTFYGRVKGDYMSDIGIENGDLLIIDKSLEPRQIKLLYVV